MSVGQRLWRALVLSVPTFALYAAHFLHADGADVTATGFIQDDMPYYVANARQYLDGQSAGVLYSNPYDYHPDSPAIYFQPFILAIAGLLSLSLGVPSAPLLILGACSTLAAYYVLVVLMERLFHDSDRLLRDGLTVIVGWGGGCLAIVGILGSMLRGGEIDPFLIDPMEGTWFLNFGRNFVYPTEAFYHLLVVLLLLAVSHGSKRWTLALVWLLALSHPYTGIQYSLILLGWGVLEFQFLDSGKFRRVDVLAAATPLAFCIVYYLGFLPTSEAHRSVVQQWTLDWSIKYPAIVGAYCLVGFLAVWRCRTSERFGACFASPLNRFLAVSFGISFALANHEAFLAPRQPIHFTRGHVWLPLCLLGLPVLVTVWNRFRPGWQRTVAALAFCVVMLFDNAVFFGLGVIQPRGIYLQSDQRRVLEFLSDQKGPIIASENELLAYLATTYSSATPYVGHFAVTPEIARKREALRAYLEGGEIPADLRELSFWVITERYRDRMRRDERFEICFQAGEIEVYAPLEEIEESR